MRRLLAIALAAGVVAAACGDSSGDGGEAGGTIRLYTSVTQDTVDAVVAAFGEVAPGVAVEVFRAPTGELTGRIATELRQGGIQADVLWLSDPLSMQQYAADGLLAEWQPENADAVPPEFHTSTFWATRLLNMVIIHQAGMDDPPQAWDDLTDPALAGSVAIPDPGFAGSAFGALATLALDDGFGIEFYEGLGANGVVQVQSPGEVLTGVAEGQYRAGMTLAKVARDAIADGSPIELVVPSEGAIAIYSPIAVVDASERRRAAEAFVDFVLSVPAQEAIAGTGWQPVHPDVEWPDDWDRLTVDWEAAFDRQQELLDAYRAAVGG